MIKTVAVIGVGPAGLAAIKELQQAGLQVTAFEKSTQIGGIWNLESSTPTGVWKDMAMNGNRRQMEFSDFEWKTNHYEAFEKAHGGVFPHCREAQRYLEDYARHFDLLRTVQFETQVEAIEKNSDTSRGGWKVTTKSLAGGTTRTHGATKSSDFDAVVVCTGVMSTPNLPLTNTLFKNFSGNHLHSQEFKDYQQFEGQRVLVIGGSISGSDIASLLARKGNCQKVVHSMRSCPYQAHVIPECLIPGDDLLFTRLPAILMRYLPEFLTFKGLKHDVLRLWPDQPNLEQDGMAPDPDIGKAGFVPNRFYMPALRQGKFSMKCAVASVESKTVTFEDGTKDDFDTVIFCTGYKSDLAFLPDTVIQPLSFRNPWTNTEDLVPYKMTLVPGSTTLAFCGVLTNYGSHWTMAEMQARWIAKLFRGTLDYPEEEDMLKGIEKQKAHHSSCRCNRAVLYTPFIEDIASEIGVAPSLWTCLRNPSAMLFAPLYACYYRTHPEIDGEEVAKQAWERFDRYVANPQMASET